MLIEESSQEEISTLKIVTLSKKDYYRLITVMAITRSLNARRISKRLLSIIKKIIPEKIAKIECYISARKEIPLKKLVRKDNVHLMNVTTAENKVYEVYVHHIETEGNQFLLVITTRRKA